jgi:hypothetical protein
MRTCSAPLATNAANGITCVPCRRKSHSRQTCFCGLFRLATTAFSAARSVALSLIWVLSCIPQTRMTESTGESARESKVRFGPLGIGVGLPSRRLAAIDNILIETVSRNEISGKPIAQHGKFLKVICEICGGRVFVTLPHE